MKELITNRQVKILLHLECSRTKFRKIELLNIGENNLKINANEIDGRLEMNAFMIAEKNLEKYNSNNFDPEYENNSFFIQRGSIIGIADMLPVFVENKKENNSNIPSIFEISSSNELKIMKLGLFEDRIKIYLPTEQYKIRNAHKNSIHSRNLMNTMIVLPALVAVLNDISHQESITMYGNLRWFGVIKKKLLKMGYDLEELDLDNERTFNVAQELLENLFSDAMDSLNYVGDST